MVILLVTQSCRTWENFITMRPATIWRCIFWTNYRTQYCRLFMKFTGTDGNINTALCATYQMDMPEFFSRRWIQMHYFVNLLGNTTYLFRSLVYDARISRWWWPTITILQLWVESADWIISCLKFYIAKHALRGNWKFKVVRLCSKLMGDSLWSSVVYAKFQTDR